MCREKIVATSQHDLDKLQQMETWGYAENTMEFFWPALRETKRFANPQGKIETELDTEIKVNKAHGNLAHTISCIEERLAALEERTRVRDLRNKEICSNVTQMICSLLERPEIQDNEAARAPLKEVAVLMLRLSISSDS